MQPVDAPVGNSAVWGGDVQPDEEGLSAIQTWLARVPDHSKLALAKTWCG